jgi:hypothetical protein
VANHYGRDATYYGPTLGQPGALLTSSDTAVLFNASEGDKIQYGSDLYPGTGSWTAEAWVRGSSYANEQFLVSYYPGGYTAYHGSQYILYLTSAGYPSWSVRDTSDNPAYITGSTSLTDDQWHHVVGVLDQGNDQMRLYVDGSLAGSASASSIGSIADSGYPVNIGWTYRYWTSDYIYLNGRLDEVALYGSALSAEQVLAHYNASVPEASTLALFGLGLAALAVVRGRRKKGST